MTVSKKDQELANRISARVLLKDEGTKMAHDGLWGNLSRLCALGRLIKASHSAEMDDMADMADIGAIMLDLSEDALGEVDSLVDRYEHLLYDSKHYAQSDSDDSGDDVLDPPTEEGIRIGQHFDVLNAEQQDTIRRVMREFPI